MRGAQVRAVRTVSTQLLELYWDIGSTILARQADAGWGGKVITRLSADLRAEFPGMKGLGRSNLEYMRRFAAAWPQEFPQQLAGELPWGHVMVLLDRLDAPGDRAWYAEQAVGNGWSRAVLEHHISTRLHTRAGAAPSNFADRLPPPDSDLVQHLVKDPYVFDFLTLTDHAREKDLEQALTDRIQDTMLELGRGFTFAGRQVNLTVDGQDFFIDLLFFHVEQLRYVVIELKVDKFRPEHAGQLGFYVAAVDDQIRNPAIHAPTVGILLCASHTDTVVRYALGNAPAPMAVATYTTTPEPTRDLALPGPEELQALAHATLAENPPTEP